MSGFLSWLLAVLLQPLPLPPAVAVPSVEGLPVPQARAALREAGLVVEVRHVTGTACLPRGRVLDQHPRAGVRRLAGLLVAIEVNNGALRHCGLGLPAPEPPWLDRVAELFVLFARGERDTPPSDTPVTLFLGGREQRVLPGHELADRERWRLCPAEGAYAGRSCPFSAPEVIGRHVGPLAVTSVAPGHACASPAAVPGGPHTVTITPDEALDCTSYWAVQLQVNDVAQVVGVNLVWAEP